MSSLRTLYTYRFGLGLLVLLILFVFTYGNYVNTLPLGVHNWAQSDRYSVSVRYLNNVNFLKAQTHNLSTIDGRCGVEFPLIQYVSARVASLVSAKHLPLIYRSFNLLLLLIGMWFFIKKWQLPEIHKLFIGPILFFSPVLFFYGFNFLPDTTGLAFLLIGLGYFVEYSKTSSLKTAIYALLFAGIATLVKTTCGIYLIAMTGTIGLQYLRPLDLKKGLTTLVFFTIIAATIWGYDYYFFHKVNEDYYSRIFMSKQQPLNNFNDLKAFWKGIKYWHGQYLTWPQTLLGVGLIGLTFFGKKTKTKNVIGGRFIVISFVGLLMFFKLMGMQFINHDYYFIVGVIPVFFMLIWYLTDALVASPIIQKKWYVPTLSILLIATAFLSVKDYEKRMSSHFIWKNRDIITDIEWMQHGNEAISTLGISQDATIFVGYDAAPNTSLVYFDRLGKAFNHEEMARDSANMKYWSERIQPDYYIFPTAWAEKLPKDQPWLYKRIVPFAKRSSFLIYKPLKKKFHKTEY